VTVYAADWVLPVDGSPIRDGAVAVEGGRIPAVGPAAELGADERFPGCAIVPGFVNAHAHLEYAILAGTGDGLPFGTWIREVVRRQRALTPDDLLASARLGAAQCLASGMTTVADASFSGASAQACSELGLRATVHLEVFGQLDAARERFAGLEQTAGPWASGLVALGISPHAPYTAAPEVYADALTRGVPVQTHLAESPAEDDFMLRGIGPIHELATMVEIESPGTTGIRLLAERGALAPAVTAAHCVTADEEEIALLAGHDVGVAHCPRSNAGLGCGIAPLGAMRRAGLRVGLGTDSPASTPSFDMFAEMRAAVAQARARERRADALTAAEALELATLGSARALGRNAEVGSLAPGKRADLTVVDLTSTPYVPWENPSAAVVFAGSPEHVSRTIVDGATRYERGRFAWHEVRGAATAARASMLAGLTAPR
jgi:5-methylthioadenosine/S-adenosylhomocysteine deaminase